MIVITSQPASINFSASIPDIIFSISGYQALIVISVDNEQIYQEKLYPMSGIVSVSDLSSLLSIYAERKLVVEVAVNISEQNADSSVIESWSMSFKVLFSRADVGFNASEFYDHYFLSILMGPKVTAMGRLEYLHYYGTETPSCEATYADGTVKNFVPQISGGNSLYTQLDVSPDNFVDDGKQLVSYVVTAGSRQQQYNLDLDVPDCAPILLFENSFGVQELLYCTGTHKVNPAYKRSSARFGGLLRNYRIEETRTFNADTGVLTTPMADWADDLFRSKEIFLVNIYEGVPTVGKEVVITESKSENSNDDDYLPRFTFSYQYAQRIHNVVDLKRVGRIFDNTFDNTFN